MSAEAIADALIALINASPRSPRREEIIEVIQATQKAPVPTAKPTVAVLGCTTGATIQVIAPQQLQCTGWHTASPAGVTVTGAEVHTAILEFLLAAIKHGRAN